MQENLYIGLPKEFSPPTAAAWRIAMLDTSAERLALYLAIPTSGWRKWILHEAKIAIALRIVEMAEKARRQDAIAAVPEDWRHDVKAHVLRLWQTREIRARYEQEKEAKRAERANRMAA